eukprot:CAMPEP_0194244730 /NCGR_PEP_ID=MMETSP0158-20130606/11846_1 /TAXON_ID=33649 /ORGANISM="Thalassionema nitzschioides, Strain L26-B" /LENGTH=162 /DNA_ID=CAMNT_0038980289 /DNA_START=59 /DNA_END=543 /DNA_ORIENTATION=+
MATLCIGGICIPYTAIIPFILMGFKWLLSFFALSSSKKDDKNKGIATAAETDGSVQIIQDDSDWESLKSKKETIILKFTADWCSPCKAIAPYFQELSQQYAAHFVELDVDEFDEISAKYQVKAMPTFLILSSDESVVGTLTGSDQNALKTFCQQHLVPKQEG